MNKPQKYCQIKISLETPEDQEEKTGFFFWAPQQIANSLQEFGIVRSASLTGEYHEFYLDARYDYEEIKTYLLSLEPTIEGENK